MTTLWITSLIAQSQPATARLMWLVGALTMMLLVLIVVVITLVLVRRGMRSQTRKSRPSRAPATDPWHEAGRRLAVEPDAEPGDSDADDDR